MTTWRLLKVRRGRLMLAVAVLRPDGLHARGRCFAWDAFGGEDGAPRQGWRVTALPIPVLGMLGLQSCLAVLVWRRADERARIVPLWVAPYVFLVKRLGAAGAVLAFLRDEPRARPALDDPARVTALLRELRGTTRLRTGLPREPMMGDAFDLHWAVVRGFERSFPRRYLGRRVDVDPVPPMSELVQAARAELPGRLRDRYSDDELAERMAPYVARPPWPFAVLLGEGA